MYYNEYVIIDPYIMAKVRLQWKIPKALENQLSESDKASLQYRNALDVIFLKHTEKTVSEVCTRE